MKKISKLAPVLAICLIFLLSACGYSKQNCYEEVERKYPDAAVHIIPGQEYRFVVIKKDGTALYVETMNQTNTDISQEWTIPLGR